MGRNMKNQKSKRVRKKLFLDEFAKFGVQVKFQFDYEDAQDSELFFDDFFTFLGDQDLTFYGGHSKNDFSAVVLSQGRYTSITDKERTEIENWLNTHKLCSDVVVSEVVDLKNII
ncbi:hypothetical protein VYA_11010 [Vibrio alfacsensis]|nr:hypothetical protein VYA_10740 [Vibrio alfacsensis]BCN23909.1 hypothetical protein VYA_11010 [Vibrio alfacsensis]